MTVILGRECGIADWVADYDRENAALMHSMCSGCSCECHWELETRDFEEQNRILSDQLQSGVDLMVKAAGQLADYEQKLRTLVDTLADEELFHESTQVAYAEAQKLLEGAGSNV